jgi:hypothetical protein
MMTPQEIEEFDRVSRENRKISLGEYWEANKHRPELKRTGRSSQLYRDKNNLYDDPNYLKPLKGQNNVKIVEPTSKEKPKLVLQEKSTPKETLGKGKAKSNQPLDISSDSEYIPGSSEDEAFEDYIAEAMRRSKKDSPDYDDPGYNGESSKGYKNNSSEPLLLL